MGENDRQQVRREMPIRTSWQCGLSPKPRDKGSHSSALPSQQEAGVFQGKFHR